jgi:spore maturation protein CgeB
MVVYSSVEDCVEKAQYLLSHPAEREAIAVAGHQRTMRDHTYRQRCAMIHDAIVRALH